MKILVDVDLTVVDTLSVWLEWYYIETKIRLEIPDGRMDHGIQDLMLHHPEPLSFWKQPDLYDDLKPIDDAVDVLRGLNDNGNEIIFVSDCFPEHINSKKRFLDKYFPFANGFINTSDKHHVVGDFVIDDSPLHLQAYFNEGVNPDNLILFATVINKPHHHIFKHVSNDWNEIGKVISN